ncbi:MAG: hypothetical protein ACFFBS_00010 [Promethearchaeota archaeon]
MTSNLVTALRIISIMAFGYSVYLVLQILSPSVWVWTALPDLINILWAVISYAFTFALEVVIFSFGVLFTSVFPSPHIQEALQQAVSGFIEKTWFGPAVSEFPPIADIVWPAYCFGFQVLLSVAIITGIFFLVRCKARLASASFLSIQGMIVLGAVLQNVTIGNTFPPADIIGFLVSPIFQVVIFTYIFLEISYHASYAHEVSQPALIRKESLRKQISAVKEEAKREVKQKEAEKPTTMSIKRKFSPEAVQYFREHLEKRLYPKESVIELESIQDIRRLDIYLNELMREDPEAESTLTAEAAVPSAAGIIRSSIPNIILRLVAVIVLAFISLNPVAILSAFGAPQPILESLELVTPEIVIIILLPIALCFPLAALIIDFHRARKVKKTVPEIIKK